MNYAELKQSIIDFTESNDTTFVDNIDTFIQNTELRIYSSVLIPVLRKNVTGSATAGNKYLSCPTDFLAPYEMAVVGGGGDGTYQYMLQKDVSFVRQNYPDPTYTSVPQYYAQFDADSFILAPTPASGYAIELHYYYYPESIVTAGMTWLGDNFPMCLLYGALAEANIFLKGEADLQKSYQDSFLENMALLKNYADGRTRNDNFRSNQPRIKLQ
jgi:hypothetical protein